MSDPNTPGSAHCVQLIHLGGSGNTGGSSCSDQLLHQIGQGLLTRSFPLSGAAARKLQQQQNGNSHFSGNISDSTHHLGAVPKGATSWGITQEHHLRTLPVELLYDDAGLTLFDQITYLPEYYLTAAEADILANSGAEIVQSCVSGDGTLIVELGAGSMRKTKLLLDAVLASGRRDVTFCALDLCQQSLEEALQALHGVYQGSFQLVGMVGTYQQGLAHLKQQQQQQEEEDEDQETICAYPESLKTTAGKPTESDEACELVRKHRVAGDSMSSMSDSSWAAAAAPSAGEDLLSRCASLSTSSTIDKLSSFACDGDMLELQPPAMDSLLLDDQGGSSTSRSRSPMPDLYDACGIDRASPALGASGYSSQGDMSLVQDGSSDSLLVSAADNEQPSVKAGTAAAPNKVILWLGSSIGNSNRNDAAAFLKELKEAAMQPGDVLLVGIDRRNDPRKVLLAYNDPTGVTNAFIMNGLKHCAQLLDNQLQLTTSSLKAGIHSAAGTTSSAKAAYTGSAGNSMLPGGTRSLSVEDFCYFSAYNNELGRHEAYYQAVRDTHILLPAGAAAAAEQGAVLGTAAAPAGPDDVAADAPGAVVVPVAAGELIHIEFSHKYSRQDVEALAQAAGLTWLTAWTDSKEQYDLHMFTC